MSNFIQLSDTKYRDYFVNRQTWLLVLNKVQQWMYENKELSKLPKKLLSEIFSFLISSRFRTFFDFDVNAGHSDNDPDIIIGDYEACFELKTAYANTKDVLGNSNCTFRGGEFSKRDVGDYFFISWDIDDVDITWFVLHRYFTENTWVSGINNGYYATSIKAEELLDNAKSTVLIGEKSKSKNDNSRFILEDIFISI